MVWSRGQGATLGLAQEPTSFELLNEAYPPARAPQAAHRAAFLPRYVGEHCSLGAFRDRGFRPTATFPTILCSMKP